MGNYTELKCKIKLRSDTPKNITDFLHRVIVFKDLGHDKVLFDSKDVFVPEFEHEFFKCDRWYMLFNSDNWSNISGGKFYYKNHNYFIDLHTEFKNSDDKIDKFISWITPYTAGHKPKQYVGYYKPESFERKINIYIEKLCA